MPTDIFIVAAAGKWLLQRAGEQAPNSVHRTLRDAMDAGRDIVGDSVFRIVIDATQTRADLPHLRRRPELAGA